MRCYVGNLADRIAGGGDFYTPSAKVAQPRTAQVMEIQERLQKLGYPIDKIDGKIGSGTRREVGTYQKTNRPEDRLLADRSGAVASALRPPRSRLPTKPAGNNRFQSRCEHDMACAGGCLAQRAALAWRQT